MQIGDRVQVVNLRDVWTGEFGTITGFDGQDAHVDVESQPGRIVTFHKKDLKVVQPIKKEKVMEYVEKSDTILGESSSVTVTSEPHHTSAVMYIRTPDHGASLNGWQMFDLIEAMLKVSGTTYEFTGAMGLIIHRPESPAVEERREELAQKFFDSPFSVLESRHHHVIEFIIEGEIKRGELR